MALALAAVIALVVGGLALIGTSRSNDSDDAAPEATFIDPPLPSTEGAGEEPDPTDPAPAELDLPEVPAGFQLVVGEDEEFAYLAPEGWETVPLSIDALRDLMDRQGLDNAAGLATMETLAESGAVTGGSISTPPDDGQIGFIESVLMMSMPAMGLTIDQLASQLEMTLGAGVGMAGSERMTIGGHDAILVSLGTVPDITFTQQLYLLGSEELFLFQPGVADPEQFDIIVDSLRVP